MENSKSTPTLESVIAELDELRTKLEAFSGHNNESQKCDLSVRLALLEERLDKFNEAKLKAESEQLIRASVNKRVMQIGGGIGIVNVLALWIAFAALPGKAIDLAKTSIEEKANTVINSLIGSVTKKVTEGQEKITKISMNFDSKVNVANQQLKKIDDKSNKADWLLRNTEEKLERLEDFDKKGILDQANGLVVDFKKLEADGLNPSDLAEALSFYKSQPSVAWAYVDPTQSGTTHFQSQSGFKKIEPKKDQIATYVLSFEKPYELKTEYAVVSGCEDHGHIASVIARDKSSITVRLSGQSGNDPFQRARNVAFSVFVIAKKKSG